MRTHEGIIEFEYKSKLKTIRFTMELSPGYGGLPLANIIDKRNHFYPLVRSLKGEWDNLTKVSWPHEFIVMVGEALEEEYLRIRRGLN